MSNTKIWAIASTAMVLIVFSTVVLVNLINKDKPHNKTITELLIENCTASGGIIGYGGLSGSMKCETK